MKILHIVPYFYPAWAYGGPPRAVFEIAQEQVKLGHSVHVLTSTAFEKDAELPHGECEIEGIHVIRVKNLSNVLMWYFHFSTAFAAASYLRKETFDVIHIHEVRTVLTYLALVNGKCRTFALSPWGTLPYNNSQVLIKKLLDWLVQPLLRKKITIAFAQTEHEITVLHEYKIGKKQVLVPLGANLLEHTTHMSRTAARKKMNLDKDTYYFLFLGRFSPFKGLDLLLDAFEQVSKKLTNTKLLLVGRDDGYQEELIDLIQSKELGNRVQVLAPLYGDQRFIAYQAANCFVFTPSVYEETGTVCLESLAVGTPVITTQQAAIPFMTSLDGVIHVLYSVSEVTTAMEDVYHKGYTVSRKKFQDHFTWNRIAEELTRSYSEK